MESSKLLFFSYSKPSRGRESVWLLIEGRTGLGGGRECVQAVEDCGTPVRFSRSGQCALVGEVPVLEPEGGHLFSASPELGLARNLGVQSPFPRAKVICAFQFRTRGHSGREGAGHFQRLL